MNPGTFFLKLALLSGATGILFFFLNRLPELQPYRALAWGSLAAFILLSIAMYFAGRRAALSTNKHDFTNVLMGFTAGKMFLSIAAIYGYHQLAQPATKLFIVPFFSIYLIYTIFESYFMMRLGRIKS
jgi:hypothetical protein